MATTETKYRTIRWQLVMLGVRLTALALAILLICTLSYEVLGKRQALLADMQVNASITGRNIAAAIVFGDKGDAQEVLARVGEEDIMHAARTTHGLRSLEEVEFAILETSGGISVIPRKGTTS